MCKKDIKGSLEVTFQDCLALTFCDVIGDLLPEWACLTLQGVTTFCLPSYFGINRIYNQFVQGPWNPSECQTLAVYDEACRVVEIAYLWHKGGFPCPCTKWCLIIFLLSLLRDEKNPLFFFKITAERFTIKKNVQTRRHVIVKVLTSQYDRHFRFVHNWVVGDNPLETRFWVLIKTHGHVHVWGRRKSCLRNESLKVKCTVFCENFTPILFSHFWAVGKSNTGIIELYVKGYKTKLEIGQFQISLEQRQFQIS